ncbi:hypothetical protein CDAR_555641 [Caerostris darwini]|uniref:Uncharacterized protein n=1 Tax=Caerostris darwini TaxID=1538125 RepID=A0AAV4QWQ9_9ARAC|nr:hypothetical protein CDAR_555641 [Caerostris darwini]
MISLATINIDCPFSRQQHSFCWCRNHKSNANSSPRNRQFKGGPPPTLWDTNGWNSSLGIYQTSLDIVLVLDIDMTLRLSGYKFRSSSSL